MHAIMRQLHRDHINFERLLSLLEAELETIANDGDPDYDLLLDVIDYVDNYPDLVHHPREDLIYHAFKAKSVEATEIVDALLEEHERMPALTRELRQILEEVRDGDLIISRASLCMRAQRYIDAQRMHLNTEESLVFPMVLEVLDDEDWRQLEASIPKSIDPLFDAEMDRYRHILRHLKREAKREAEQALA